MRHSDPVGKIQGKEPGVPGLLLPGFQWLCYRMLGKAISVSPGCLPGWERGANSNPPAAMRSAVGAVGETATGGLDWHLGETWV